MKIIQVGLGGFGAVWLEHVVHPHEGLDIVGLVDVNRNVFEEVKAKLGLQDNLYYPSLEDALQAMSEHGNPPDFVLNVTPSKFHRDINLTAFRYGIPVLSEKPLADSQDEAREILQQSKNAGVAYAVSQNYRYKDVMLKAKQLLDEGRIGRIENVYVEFFRAPQVEGYRQSMPYVLLIDMAIHHFDLMRYLTGTEPASVRATSWNPSWSWFQGDANLHAEFLFGGNIRIFYSGSWVSKLRESSWDGVWKIEGTEGCLVIENDELRIFTDVKEEVLKVPDLNLSMCRSLDGFMLSLQQGKLSQTAGTDNIRSFAMVTESVRSIQEKRTVTFD